MQLVNSRHARQLAGRPKTDRLDAQWIARLAEMGLLRPSFVPPPEIRALRDLTRTRLQLVRDRTREWQRLEKLLEGRPGQAVVRGVLAGQDQDGPRSSWRPSPAASATRGPWPAWPPDSVKGGRAAIAEALEGMQVRRPPPHADPRPPGPHRPAGPVRRRGRGRDRGRPGRHPRRLGRRRRRRDRPGAGRGPDAAVLPGGGAARGDPRRQPGAGPRDHRRDRPGHEPSSRPPPTWPPGPGWPPSPASPGPGPASRARGTATPTSRATAPRPRPAPPEPARSSASGSAACPGAWAGTGPDALSPGPSSSSSGTCCPTPAPGSPTSDPAGTTAGPTATARSAPTSASSRPSASTSNISEAAA